MLILVWKKKAESSFYISRHMFQKFSNTSVHNNVLLWTCKSWYSLNFFYLQIFTNSFFMQVICISKIFHNYVPVKIFFSNNDVPFSGNDFNFFNFSSNFCWKFLLKRKHLCSIKSPLKSVYSRKLLQYLYLYA